jgi:hypothetical protein
MFSEHFHITFKIIQKYLGKQLSLFSIFLLFYYSKIFEGIPELIIRAIWNTNKNNDQMQNLFQNLEEFGFNTGLALEFLGFIAINLLLLFICFLLLSWAGRQVTHIFGFTEIAGRFLGILFGCITLFAYDHAVFKINHQNSVFFIGAMSFLAFLTLRVWKLAVYSRKLHKIKRISMGLLLSCICLPSFFSLSIPEMLLYFRWYSLSPVILFLGTLFFLVYRIPERTDRISGMRYFKVLLLLCLALIFSPRALKMNCAQILMFGAPLISAWACFSALIKIRHRFQWRFLVPIAVLCLFAFMPLDNYSQNDKVRHGKNIIIVGVDDLSPDMLMRANKLDLAPTLKNLAENGIQYSRAYTPLGRTSAAWASILSGDSPQEHGSYFNLRDLKNIKKEHFVTFKLRELGYKTIWALDERRFNYMDETFGFDKVVGPKTGLMEFFLKDLTRFPVNNILLQFSFSKKIFPYAYENAGYGTTYNPNGFVRSILSSVQDSDKPIFLAVHFESAHYPWETRPVQKLDDDVKVPNPIMRRALETVAVVDRQVRNLLQGLERQGALDDALVIFLSDHGEGFLETENKVKMENVGFVNIRGYGHGNEVLSDRANHAVLSILHFKNGKIVSLPETRDEQVSLLDIKNTIENYLENGDIHVYPKNACIIVETGKKVGGFGALAAKGNNNLKIIETSLPFYRLNPEGFVYLREDKIKELIASKDIGVRCKDRITYFSPDIGYLVAHALNAEGIPDQLIPPPEEDIARISRYMTGYGLDLPQSTLAIQSPELKQRMLIRDAKQVDIMDNR